MSILTVGSIPDRGMRSNLPIVMVALRCTDNGYCIFQPPAAYLGDEQMLCILGRGHLAPTVTVTKLIFVRAQCLNHFAIKACYASHNNNWIQTENGPVECLIGWKVSRLVCLNIYNPVHPSCTRIARYLHHIDI